MYVFEGGVHCVVCVGVLNRKGNCVGCVCYKLNGRVLLGRDEVGGGVPFGMEAGGEGVPGVSSPLR